MIHEHLFNPMTEEVYPEPSLEEILEELRPYMSTESLLKVEQINEKLASLKADKALLEEVLHMSVKKGDEEYGKLRSIIAALGRSLGRFVSRSSQELVADDKADIELAIQSIDEEINQFGDRERTMLILQGTIERMRQILEKRKIDKSSSENPD